MADNQPLLPHPAHATSHSHTGHTHARIQQWRRRSQHYLASKQKHYLILTLVGLDVVAILTEILVSLVTCETGTEDQPWVDPVLEATKIIGLVISSLFLAELLSSLWAFGTDFFSSWFHCFDAFVILVSFVVDVLAHGVLEEIASLVIVLRLWRVVKIVEEMSVGAEEQMEELEAQVEKLEKQNADLERRLRALEAGNE
ncbi:ion transporter [Sporothrix brasiliensis 5110]|uniref:Voltage-gated hydrogen channel 1 n=1 Tax=Sporothrix brasiliensis 5110 TaxID=1398154 RepID=A0A0C2F6Y3_9PEZI|nr:ion transporter [Sporothrix brasiliensis 5110]KIH86803.1 ion transporter [Sporothrix brasiliensis 5110]